MDQHYWDKQPFILSIMSERNPSNEGHLAKVTFIFFLQWSGSIVFLKEAGPYRSHFDPLNDWI